MYNCGNLGMQIPHECNSKNHSQNALFVLFFKHCTGKENGERNKEVGSCLYGSRMASFVTQEKHFSIAGRSLHSCCKVILM